MFITQKYYIIIYDYIICIVNREYILHIDLEGNGKDIKLP